MEWVRGVDIVQEGRGRRLGGGVAKWRDRAESVEWGDNGRDERVWRVGK